MVTVRSDEERVQSIINFFKDYKFYILAVILASTILVGGYFFSKSVKSVSYTHLRAHETP